MIQEFAQTKEEYPATGIAFGLDVIYEALKEKNTELKMSIPQILLIALDDFREILKIAKELRDFGISCDIAFNKKTYKNVLYVKITKII